MCPNIGASFNLLNWITIN